MTQKIKKAEARRLGEPGGKRQRKSLGILGLGGSNGREGRGNAGLHDTAGRK